MNAVCLRHPFNKYISNWNPFDSMHREFNEFKAKARVFLYFTCGQIQWKDPNQTIWSKQWAFTKKIPHSWSFIWSSNVPHYVFWFGIRLQSGWWHWHDCTQTYAQPQVVQVCFPRWLHVQYHMLWKALPLEYQQPWRHDATNSVARELIPAATGCLMYVWGYSIQLIIKTKQLKCIQLSACWLRGSLWMLHWHKLRGEKKNLLQCESSFVVSLGTERRPSIFELSAGWERVTLTN